MSYINFPSPTPVFPTLAPLAWSRNKKPMMASKTWTSASGREVQIARAVFPTWKFTLVYGGDSWLRDQTQNIVPYLPLTGKTEFEHLCGLYLQCLGPYGEFYYQDPDDNSRLNQSAGIGDGLTTNFPLTFTWGQGPFNPPMALPVQGLISIDNVYFNGGSPISPSLYTIDASNTELQFYTAPGLYPALGPTITADFHFYFRCRFDEDKQEYEEWALNLWENKTVKFQSVKP